MKRNSRGERRSSLCEAEEFASEGDVTPNQVGIGTLVRKRVSHITTNPSFCPLMFQHRPQAQAILKIHIIRRAEQSNHNIAAAECKQSNVGASVTVHSFVSGSQERLSSSFSDARDSLFRSLE